MRAEAARAARTGDGRTGGAGLARGICAGAPGVHELHSRGGKRCTYELQGPAPRHRARERRREPIKPGRSRVSRGQHVVVLSVGPPAVTLAPWGRHVNSYNEIARAAAAARANAYLATDDGRPPLAAVK